MDAHLQVNRPLQSRDAEYQRDIVTRLALADKAIAICRRRIELLKEVQTTLVHFAIRRKGLEEGSEMADEQTFTLSDIFTPDEIRRIGQIWHNTGRHGRTDEFRDKVTVDILTDDKLTDLRAMGRDFDREYLAQVVEFLMSK